MSLAVEQIGPGATVQDRGRRGSMHLGVPRGGPWDPVLFERVRASLGNAPEAAAVEIPWHRARFRAVEPVTVSVDGDVLTLAAGDLVEVAPAVHAVRYLGVLGGVDAPVVLGGRGTLLVAGLGGHEGRMLRRGDVLRAEGLRAVGLVAPSAPLSMHTTLAVHIVGDAPEACVDALLREAFTVRPQLDRVGTRLGGEMPPASHGGGASVPLRRGAIEVTPGGELIVMGPDHPTTGGYPVVAVLSDADQAALARHRPGTSLRFVAASTPG